MDRFRQTPVFSCFRYALNTLLQCGINDIHPWEILYIEIIEATHSSSQCRFEGIGDTPPPNCRSSSRARRILLPRRALLRSGFGVFSLLSILSGSMHKRCFRLL